MVNEVDPKLRHWLETPKPRIKKINSENGKRSFLSNLVLEIKRVLEEF